MERHLKVAETIVLANDAKREQIFFAIYQFTKNNDVYCLAEDSIIKPKTQLNRIYLRINLYVLLEMLGVNIKKSSRQT